MKYTIDLVFVATMITALVGLVCGLILMYIGDEMMITVLTISGVFVTIGCFCIFCRLVAGV
jgi:hypothetical protein